MQEKQEKLGNDNAQGSFIRRITSCYPLGEIDFLGFFDASAHTSMCNEGTLGELFSILCASDNDTPRFFLCFDFLVFRKGS